MRPRSSPGARRTALACALALAAAATVDCTSLLGIDGPYRAAADAGDVDDSPAEATVEPDGSGEAGDAADAGADTVEPPDAAGDGPAGSGQVTAVVAGRFYTCALLSGGTARCWGQNVDGEFGNGTVTSSAVPVAAMGAGLASLWPGPGDTCAVLQDGGGECAGQGGSGQLGDGVVDADSPVPVAASALPSAPLAFAVGVHFACAIVATGDVYCFGGGSLGQLGDGALADSATPVKVDLGGAHAKAISALWQHACALTTTGTVYCWGDDSSGQLGNGVAADGGVAAPVQVMLGGPATEIAAGAAHSCAIVGTGSNNGVWCWGLNTDGELGDGTGVSSPTPVQVAGIQGVAGLTAGNSHTCVGLAYGGGVACWGAGGSGQLGNGDTKNALSPVDVSMIGGAPASLAAGGFHTCALVASPNVLCWGADDFGQLGNDDPLDQQQSAPVPVKW